SVRNFGEMEFWFALITVAAIVCLIVVGVVLVATGFVSPQGNRAMVGNLWYDGGFFATGFMGVVGGLQVAFFAFVGVELVGAPSPFRRLNRGGVPSVALFLTAALLLTSIPLLYVGGSVMGAFTLVTTIASLLFMFVWGVIVVSYLVYRRRHAQRHSDSSYKMP